MGPARARLRRRANAFGSHLIPLIYLDHNATTPVRPEVLEAMLPYLKDNYGNASSIYQLGQQSRKAIEDARAAIATFIGASSPEEIIFTSGGTEANNFAIKGVVLEHRKKGRRVISSAIEHSSVRNVVRDLAQDGLIDSVVVPVEPNGTIKVANVDDAMTPDTVLVTIMGANNETGVYQPIKDIVAAAKKKNILVHCDGVQMAGKTQLHVDELGVDLFSLSGHKFGAPKGIGILYVRKGTRLKSLMLGGRQEKNRRGGTENVAGIVGAGKAAQLEMQEMTADVAKLKTLRDQLENGLLKNLTHCFVNGDKTNRTVNTTNICFEYTDSSEMIMALDLKGLACSSGSACQAGSADPSHVLLAMGLPQDKAHASLRFSLGHTTTAMEIESAIGIITDTVNQLRKRHPLWNEMVKK